MFISKLPRSTFWFMMIALVILLADFATARLLSSTSDDKLVVYAILVDLMLVIPFLYWLFIVRKSKKSVGKVLFLPLLGAMLAWLFLPAHLRPMIWKIIVPFETLLFVVEAVFIVYEVRVLFEIVRRFRQISRQEQDFGEALRMTMEERLGLGKLASLMLHDVTMFYYLLFSWKKKPVELRNETTAYFTYHRNTSQVLMYAIFTKIILVEGVAVHLLMQQWSSTAAWIFTIADIWLLVLIWADCRASILNPINLQAGRLRLRVGLRIQADIPVEYIAAVTSSSQFLLNNQDRKEAVQPIFGTPNVKIELSRPLRIQGLLFLPRQCQTIYLALDEPEFFVKQINQAII
jgi:hypothetical protein